MTAQLIDGKAIAQKIRDEVAAEVAKRTAAGKPQPTLATVLVGDRTDSAAYVSSKGKACLELGMGSISEHLPADASQDSDNDGWINLEEYQNGTDPRVADPPKELCNGLDDDGNGLIDEVCIFDRALTQAQIRAIFTNAPVSGKIPSTSDVNIASGATLNLSGISQTAASLSDFSGAAEL